MAAPFASNHCQQCLHRDGGCPSQSVSEVDSEELIGDVEGQCGPMSVKGCTPSHPNPGIFIEGKKTAILQNSVSQ